MLLFAYILIISTRIFKIFTFFLPSYNPFKVIHHCMKKNHLHNASSHRKFYQNWLINQTFIVEELRFLTYGHKRRF